MGKIGKSLEDENQPNGKNPSKPARTVNKTEVSIEGLINFINSNSSALKNGNKLSIKTIKNDYEKLIETIIVHYKAKKYIGVGVGCILLNSNKDKVLLYKRYKDPEKDKWSMPGGGVPYGYKVEDVAIEELSNITGISFFSSENKTQFQLKLLKITNHYPDSRKRKSKPEFHYVSPAFYIDIKEDSDIWDQIRTSFNETTDIFKVDFEKPKQERGELGQYNLKWFSLNQSFRTSEYTQTTVFALQALKKHLIKTKKISELPESAKSLQEQLKSLPELFDSVFEDVMNT